MSDEQPGEQNGAAQPEGAEATPLPTRSSVVEVKSQDLPAEIAADFPPGTDVRIELSIPEPTGDPVLDEMLQSLAASAQLPLEDQVPVIEAVHRGLQDRLTDVEG